MCNYFVNCVTCGGTVAANVNTRTIILLFSDIYIHTIYLLNTSRIVTSVSYTHLDVYKRQAIVKPKVRRSVGVTSYSQAESTEKCWSDQL